MDMMPGLLMAAALDEEEKEKGRKKMNESYVSPILKSLIGKECVVDSDELDNERCTVLDVDAVWIMLRIHGKKGDVTFVEKVDSINEIQVL